jgi:CheY-like chemotaxis protein
MKAHDMTNDASGKPRIVLIEDNPSDVFLMSLALEENGVEFELTNFQSGAEALPILCPDAGATDHLPLPDLIVLDLNTPGPDGFQVLARIKSNADLDTVPVAILTSSNPPPISAGPRCSAHRRIFRNRPSLSQTESKGPRGRLIG